VFVETKQPDQALTAFSTALSAQPTFAPARMERGALFMERNDDDRSIREFRDALRVDPKLADAYVKIGMIHQRRSQLSEAEAAYLSAVEIEPRHAVAYNNLAWMAAQRKVNLGQALAWANKATTLAPQIADFQDTLGWVHRARGALKNAEFVLLKSAAVKPPRAEFVYHLAVVQHELGKRPEARAGLNRALAIDSSFPDATDARRRLKQLIAGP
jgi:Tfp pilus assembly protein PilF